MNFYLLSAAVVLLVLLAFLFLFDKIPFFYALEIKSDPPTYAYTILNSLLDFLCGHYAVPLLSMVLALIVMVRNLSKDLTDGENRMAMAILLLILITYGPVLNIFFLLKATYILLRGLSKSSVLLFVDFFVVLAPCVLLILLLTGTDYRTAFLYSLVPVIVLSLCLKLLFGLINFQLQT